MKNGRITGIVNKFLSKYNRKIVWNQAKNIEKRKIWVRDFLLKQSNENIIEILAMEEDSESQFKQDLFVLSELNFKENGYFVEFGATNGKDLSNTFILEKKYNWKGIVSEPAKGWQQQLKKNRNCNVETDCVWSSTGDQLEFSEAEIGILSTISSFRDESEDRGKKRKTYTVSTISLMDMLAKYNAPTNIDYLSIDTEGSEYEILKEFDFQKYDIKIISVEYNNNREVISELLLKNNYARKFTEVSECDDWYVKI